MVVIEQNFFTSKSVLRFCQAIAKVKTIKVTVKIKC
jgi:hypothetical protein